MSGELKLKIEQSRSRGEPLAETTLSRYMWVPDLGLALRVLPRYGIQFRGRLLGPRDLSLPLTG
eukprot:3883706-Prymnesium_polylepis.1